MECNSNHEPTNNTQLDLPLTSFIIKSEQEDQPDFVDENDLVSYIENESETSIEQSTNSLNKEKYNCVQCGEEFPDPKYVECHAAIHDPKLHCPVCDRIFKSEKYFILHIKQHLKDPLRCKQCPEMFLDKRSYNLHLFSHKKVKSYTCEYCLKEWTNKKDLTVHIRVHTNERPYTCADCGRSFKQKGGLTSHITTLHSGVKRVIKDEYSCDICSGTYSSVSSLNKHMKKIHEAGKTFPCRKCGETFLNFRQMKEHKSQLHPEIIYNRVCPLCNQNFSSREAFVKHQLIHTDTEKKSDEISYTTPVDCYLCGEQTFGVKGLFKHQQKHLLMTDEEMEACIQMKKFICKVCGKQFNFKKSLVRHMDTHLEKKYECKVHCSEKFTYLGIRLHLEWYFEQFKCLECNETFRGRKNLRLHYQIHPMISKFTCKICGLKYRHKKLLVAHWKMQHNIKCHICFKNFLTHFDLKRHTSIKHKVKCESQRISKRIDNKVFAKKGKYPCKVCKHTLSTMKLLEDHMKGHKKMCFQCEKCKKNFLYFRNWMFHIKENICRKYFDDESGSSLHSCIVCKKTYPTVQSLMTHVRRHSTIHKCKLCNSKFKLKDMQDHINRAHPGAGKYACDSCSLCFFSRNDLMKHKFSHEVTIKQEIEENISQIYSTKNPMDHENSLILGDDHLLCIKEESKI